MLFSTALRDYSKKRLNIFDNINWYIIVVSYINL